MTHRHDHEGGGVMEAGEWRVWFGREWGVYKVARCLDDYGFGAIYQYAKSPRGWTLYFLTKGGAQKCADRLNAEPRHE